MNASNPLLHFEDLPPFDRISPDQVEPALDQLLAANRAAVEKVLQQTDHNWQQLIVPLDEAGDRLSRSWSPVSHLNGVKNNAELRSAYEQCLPKLSEFSTWFSQHPSLFEAYRELAEKAGESLNTAQQKMLDNTLRDFRLSGVDLPEARKQRFADIQKRLSELTNRFSNNVLDASQGWSKHITDAAELVGLPPSALDSAAAAAAAKNLQGWLFTLDFPSFQPVMTYADNRALRQEVYTAFVTRASDQGPQAGQWDNAPLMEEILALREEKAALLGFASYAHLSVERKMARSPEEVIQFLEDLAARAHPQAQQEFAELQAFAAEQGVDHLQPWDVGYYSEKLRQARYAISQEELRPWFPAPRVIEGLFQVAGRLFDLSFEMDASVPTWHPDARYYRVVRNGQPLAGFYLDLYAREGKRGGAWMDVCRNRRRTADDQLQLPVAYLTCNFTAPVGGKPSLLTHTEVTTLFHEFGHGLHHMLTQVDVADVAGINGVAWDAVELPSQFMENFCWEREGLDLITGHIDTGEPLPQNLFEKMLAAKNFQSAMQLVRQLEFSLFDFRLHLQLKKPDAAAIQGLLDQVRQQVSVVPTAAFNRFQNSFSHIFAGGYAAGYYSYKWAEVLSADAFSAFEEEGIFNPETGRRFCREILEKGGSQDAMELFINFRGREPQVDALLRHSGITG
ncbi:oligopeptidase A [Marinospirillum alkaliphilum]|uniref:oligopeptidase A n=1 Tax=Marinospirillum alkaliphilum DSM 21637 TaxID=1122209 RepID=A0A1K1VDE7_9GAMM|nr:oligopeptidase A [Marinospirillum alkaliphilum]SFX23160.1 oligopeptidase A [Marinospirillum alkaliphilum DSM 21637]